MSEYGYEEICGRVLGAMDNLLFDEFVFLDSMHRDTFWNMYGRFIKSVNKKDNGKTAVIYLLSTKEIFQTILVNYVSNPFFVLPRIIKGCNDEETYNIYPAVKMMAGMESGLYEENLLEDDLIDDKVLCLIMAAKLIKKHGVIECWERQISKHQNGNRAAGYGKQQNIYVYNGQAIRIK